MKNLTFSSDKKIDTSLVKVGSKKIKKIQKFNELLESLNDIDDKKKSLWIEIYNNALIDRQHAYDLYEDVSNKIFQDQVNHATYGTQATKYLERLNKANDQLIKLAELIASSEKQKETINVDDIFSTIEG
jgi:hypothetical protein